MAAKKRKREDEVRPVPTERQYIGISIEEFFTDSFLLSDIYIKTSADRYIRVAKEADPVPVERLKTYKSHGVDTIFVTEEGFVHYKDYNLRVAMNVKKARILAGPERFQFYLQTMENIIGRSFTRKLESSAIEAVETIVEEALEFINNDPKLSELISHLESDSQKLFSHSVAVSFLACVVARRGGWTQRSTLVKVALSGLFHDIGLRDINEEIVYADPSTLTLSQQQLLISHPQRGRDILAEVKGIPEGVAQVAYQHQETCIGTGYPNGIHGDQMSPMSKLISVVDRFCELIAPPDRGHQSVSPLDAISILKHQHTGEYDKDYLAIILDLFRS